MDRAAELAGRKGTMRTPREFFDLAETGELASNFSEKDLISYATACVAEALAPRDASPELAEVLLKRPGKPDVCCHFEREVMNQIEPSKSISPSDLARMQAARAAAQAWVDHVEVDVMEAQHKLDKLLAEQGQAREALQERERELRDAGIKVALRRVG